MSSIFKSIYSYLFSGGKTPDKTLQANAPPKVNTNIYDSHWTKCKQEDYTYGELGGDSNLDKLDKRIEERWSSGIEENQTHKCKHSQFAADKDKLDCDYSDFAKACLNAAGTLKKWDEIQSRENDLLLNANNDKIRVNDINGASFAAKNEPDAGSEKSDSNVDESQSILPELTSEESSEDDTLQFEDCREDAEGRGEVTQEEGRDEEVSRETLVSPVSQNDAHHMANLPPSMPILDNSGVEPHILTVIPLDKTPIPQIVYSDADSCNDEGISRFIVLTKRSSCPTPNSATPRAVDAKSNFTSKEVIHTAAITKTDSHPRLFSTCKALTLGEMYERFNSGNLQTTCIKKNTSANTSPTAQTKKLLDVNLYSRLKYNPEPSPVKTPSKSSDLLVDATTPNSDSWVPENVSSALGSPSDNAVRSSGKSFTVKLVKNNDACAKAACTNRKFILIKSKNSDLTTTPTRGPALHPSAAAVNSLHRKVDIATPKTFSSNIPCRNSAKTSSVGTPRPTPAPKTSSLGVRSGQRGVVGSSAVRQGGQRVVKRSVTCSDQAVASISRVSVTQARSVGKRPISEITTRDHGPSKKKRLEDQRKATPHRQSIRVFTSKVNVPRSLRRRSSEVSYKV